MSEKKDIVYVFQGEGLNDDEKKWGRQRFKEYRISYPHLNKLANLHILEELVWKETIQERFKKQIGHLGITKEKNGITEIVSIPKPLQESINDGLTQIIDIKNKLGMFEDQKVTDEFEKIQLLKEKAAEYRRQHPLSFRTTCPHCAKHFYLKRRTENFESFKSPFADDNVINNRPLFNLYKTGKLTKEEVADVLGVSPDYVDWLDEKIYNNVLKKLEK